MAQPVDALVLSADALVLPAVLPLDPIPPPPNPWLITANTDYFVGVLYRLSRAMPVAQEFLIECINMLMEDVKDKSMIANHVNILRYLARRTPPYTGDLNNVAIYCEFKIIPQALPPPPPPPHIPDQQLYRVLAVPIDDESRNYYIRVLYDLVVAFRKQRLGIFQDCVRLIKSDPKDAIMRDAGSYPTDLRAFAYDYPKYRVELLSSALFIERYLQLFTISEEDIKCAKKRIEWTQLSLLQPELEESPPPVTRQRPSRRPDIPPIPPGWWSQWWNMTREEKQQDKYSDRKELTVINQGHHIRVLYELKRHLGAHLELCLECVSVLMCPSDKELPLDAQAYPVELTIVAPVNPRYREQLLTIADFLERLVHSRLGTSLTLAAEFRLAYPQRLRDANKI